MGVFWYSQTQLSLDSIYLILASLLVLWALYDLAWLHVYPKSFVSKNKKEIIEKNKARVKKILQDCIDKYAFDTFPPALQKAQYFQSLRKHIKKQIKPGGLYHEEIQDIVSKYQNLLGDIFFQEISFPFCKEDLKLIGYKLMHQERETDFALCSLEAMIEKNLAEDLLLLCQNQLGLHRQKVEAVRRSIQKDQDALCVLGMEIPLKEAKDVIVHSGEEFDIAGIYPKSLSFIAKEACPEEWDIFCSLIVKASAGKTIKLLQIYSFDPSKGETVPMEFLEYTIEWLREKKPIAFLPDDWNYIEERMSKMARIDSRIDTSRIQHQDEEARKILDDLTTQHLASYESALKYLQLQPNNLSMEEIRIQIGTKRKSLNQKLTTASREKRKGILVEIHFLSHELPEYLFAKERQSV